MNYLFKAIMLSLVLFANTTWAAEYEVTNANTKLYSNEYKIDSGSLKSDNRTIYSLGYMSNGQVKVKVSSSTGKVFNNRTAFVVYKGSITTSNEVASSGNLKGKSYGYVTFAPSSGNYIVQLFTRSSDGTQTVSFFINEAIVVKEKVVTPPTINSVTTSPSATNITAGDYVTFKAYLSKSLPSGYSATLLIDGASETSMSCSSTTCQFSRKVDTVDTNRKYTVYIKQNNVTKSSKVGSYDVKAPAETQYAPSVTIISAGSSVVESQNYQIQLSLRDQNSNLKNVQVNWGDGTSNTVVELSGGNSSKSINHTYSNAGSYTWGATVHDHTGKKSSAQKTVSVTSNAPTINSVTTSPSPTNITAGDDVTFKAYLSKSLPSGYSATLQIDGGWSEVSMSCSSTLCQFSRKIDTVDTNRKYTVYIKQNNVTKSSKVGSYNVRTPAETQYAPSVTIISAGSAVVESQDYQIQLSLRDQNSNLKNVQVNWGDETSNTVVELSGGNSSKSINHTYSNSGSYTWRAEVHDHTGKKSSAQKTVSVTSNAPTINSVTTSPSATNITAGDDVTFQAYLSKSLPSGYSATLQIDGAWSEVSMSCSSTLCQFSRKIDTVDTNRKYTVYIKQNNVTKSSKVGSYNVKTPAETQYAPSVTIVSAGSAVVEGQNYQIALKLTDQNSNLKNVQINWGDGTSLTIIELSGGNTTENISHTYKDSGSYTWSATVSDHTEEPTSVQKAVVVDTSVSAYDLDAFKASFINSNVLVENILIDKNINEKISRAEAVILLDIFLSNKSSVFASKNMDEYLLSFADVDASADYYSSLLKLSYFNGFETEKTVITKANSLFRPLDFVSRQEFISMMLEGLDLKLIDDRTLLSDFKNTADLAKVADWAWDYFNTAVYHGLIRGNRSDPLNPILDPIGALSVYELFLILSRAEEKFEGYYVHVDSQFEVSTSLETSTLLQKQIGFDFEPRYYESTATAIAITDVNSTATNALQQCGVNNARILTVLSTTDVNFSTKVDEYFWWKTNEGYFKQLSTSDNFKSVCFIPATVKPDSGYRVVVHGGDNIGYVDSVVYVDLDTDVIHALDDYSRSVSTDNSFVFSGDELVRANGVYKINIAGQLTKSDINMGIENLIVRMLGSGVDELVFIGQPINDEIVFSVPNLPELYGKTVQFSIQAHTQHATFTAVLEAKEYRPKFVIRGVIYNVDDTAKVDYVTIANTKVYLDENNQFILELASESGVLNLSLTPHSGSEINSFDSITLDLTYDNSERFIVMVGEDRRVIIDDLDQDDDGVLDSVDAFPTDPSASADTDNDGKPDTVAGTSTTSLIEDTDDDNDGIFDLDEIANGTDPLDSNSGGNGSSPTDIVSGASVVDANAVTSPNGGEVWLSGTSQNVTWNNQLITGSTVELYVLHDDPSGLLDANNQAQLNTVINAKNWHHFAQAVPNTGSYQLDPALMAGSGNAYIAMVVSSQDKSIFDIGNGMFTLDSNSGGNGSSPTDIVSGASVVDANAVTSPNGGEEWLSGTSQNVTWNNQLITGSTVELYVLHDDPSDLFDANNQTQLNTVINVKNWNHFAQAVPNTGSYQLDPALMAGSGNAYVVMVVSSQDKSIFDIGNGMFTLDSSSGGNGSSPTDIVSGVSVVDANAVTSPNGGELWLSGTSQNVTWNNQLITGSTVELYVLHDDPSGLFDANNQTQLNTVINAKNWHHFAQAVPNTGSYQLDPALMAGSGNAYVVMVVSSQDKSIFDIGNGMFTLALDTTLPVISVPISIEITIDEGMVISSNHSELIAYLTFATATDNVDGPVSVTNDTEGLDEFPLGTTVVRFSATDASGNAIHALSTFTVNSLDNDADGLPNTYELQHAGLDINSPDDASGDLDGDGLSNLEEFQQGFNIAVDDVPPVLTIPSNVTVNSTGPTTPVDLGLATAVDFKDGTIIPSVNDFGPFIPGHNVVTWSATDQSGNVATDQQIVDVIPMVSFTTSQSVDEGSSVTVSLSLNGSPVAYPVVVPFTVSGSADSSADHDLVDGDITIESPDTSATLNFSTAVDDVWEGDETVVIIMGTPTNAVEGSMTSHSVTIKEENIEPVVTLGIVQGGKPVTTITADGGLVTLTATIDDPNPTDQHVVDWSQTNNNLVPTNGYNNGTFLFDPSLLTAGLYNVEVSATDDGQGQLTSMTDSMLRVISTAPVLSAGNDSDGDGVSDLDEGTGDNDQDRIPDYLDSVDAANQLPSNDNDAVMQVDNGLKLRLGETAFAADVPAAQVTVQDLMDHGGSGGGVATNAEDNAYQFPSGVFDFEVSGTVPGDSVRVVIPQSSAVPANAVYRKYTSGTGWFDFSINAKNSVASAPGALGICPAPGDASYIIGLTEGHFCVQLTIEDGGNNDADNQVNGVVKDPGGVAVQLIPVPVVGLAKTETSSTTFNSGDGEQVVFAFSLSSDSTDAEVHEFTVSASGEMDVTTDIDSVTLYRDDNKNGIPEAVESVAIGSVDADNGDLSFALPQAYQLPVGDTHFLVTYQF
jgi:hypothetical protein